MHVMALVVRSTSPSVPAPQSRRGLAGVQFVQGANNTLTNRGTITNLAGIGATTIIGGTGNEPVQNFGIVTGNVDLGTGVNSFNNLSGGLFNSGATVDLGTGNVLTNSGALSPGGTATVLTTVIAGNLVQSGSGVFAVDVNGASADRVNVTGTAGLAGKVQPTLFSLGTTNQWTILSAAGGLTPNGITVKDLQILDSCSLTPMTWCSRFPVLRLRNPV
jgi:hypothetical protein